MPASHSNDESQRAGADFPNARSAPRFSSDLNLRMTLPSRPISRRQGVAEEWTDLLPGRKVEQEVLDLLDGK